MRISITLPWPDKNLSPNARPHYMTKSTAVKAARGLAKMYAVLAMRKAGWPKGKVENAESRVTFVATDRRKRDRDNHQAMCKAYFDGIADAGLIKNDCGFIHHPLKFEVGTKREVRIEIETKEV